MKGIAAAGCLLFAAHKNSIQHHQGGEKYRKWGHTVKRIIGIEGLAPSSHTQHEKSVHR